MHLIVMLMKQMKCRTLAKLYNVTRASHLHIRDAMDVILLTTRTVKALGFVSGVNTLCQKLMAHSAIK